MRALELHATFKQVKRSAGRSSVAAAAYRSGSRLIDHRTGEINDYTRKGGVEDSAIFAPANAPEWARDRSQLWNAAEQKENRKNSMTAREFEISFPAEFTQQQRVEAGSTIADALVKRFGVAADICWHEPNTEGDQRNHHAHILFTGRSFDPSTKDGWSKNKYRDFNNDQLEVDGEKTTTGRHTVKEFRKMVAVTYNQIAKRDGLEVKTEHESFKDRGIDQVPQIKLGHAATAMERKGHQTDRGDINRRISALNQLKTEIRKAQQELNTFVANSKRALKVAGEKINPRATPEQIKKTWEQYLNAAIKEVDERKLQRKTDLITAKDTLKAFEKKKPQEQSFSSKVPIVGYVMLPPQEKKYNQALKQWEDEKTKLRQNEQKAKHQLDYGYESPKPIAKSKFEKDHPALAKEWEKLKALEDQDAKNKRTNASRSKKAKPQSFSR